jgi:hypothetical protein
VECVEAGGIPSRHLSYYTGSLAESRNQINTRADLTREHIILHIHREIHKKSEV